MVTEVIRSMLPSPWHPSMKPVMAPVLGTTPKGHSPVYAALSEVDVKRVDAALADGDAREVLLDKYSTC